MNKLLSAVVLAAGLAVIAWVGAGYLAANPLALAMTGVIAAVYLAGALELRRYAQATQGLEAALAATTATPPALADWLATLPADEGLRTAARLRVEGTRAALPGPALAPYLAGLLVLLGMLGTFLGMVATLKGTGAALEHASDLTTMRDSLAAPVRGLGLAFGTSVAGVAASAALGLLAALARRHRQQQAQRLDAAIAGVLRPLTPAFLREQQRRAEQEAAQALQRQQAELIATTLPTLLTPLVTQLQTTMAAMQADAQRADERLLAGQERFHAQSREVTQAAYQQLADSVDRTLRDSLAASLAESSRQAAATLQPLAEATMAGITRETAALHGQIAGAATQQLDALAQRFDAHAREVAEHWRAGLARLADDLAAQDQQRLAAWTAALGTSASALETTATRIAADSAAQAQGTLGEIARLVEASAEAPRAAAAVVQQLQGAAERFEQQTAALLSGVEDGRQRLAGEIAAQDQQRLAAWTDALAANAATLAATAERIAADSAAQTGTLVTEAQRLVAAGAEGPRAAAEVLAQLQAATAQFQQQAGAVQQSLDDARLRLAGELAAQDAQRLAAWTASLTEMAGALQRDWAAAGAATQAQQAQICQTLEATAARIAEQAEAHARGTISEIAQLVKTASDAPRAAAEVVAELRSKLSESMVRDNAMLEERTHMMATLTTLLDAVQQASGEQKAAIDRLIETSAASLVEAGARLDTRAADQGERIERLAVQLGGSAVEVASLGEAFGAAVEQFGRGSERLLAHLQRLDDTLTQSIARSDDQLAYYVAQAREVIDLSIASQKQIVEDLQRIASGQAATAGQTA